MFGRWCTIRSMSLRQCLSIVDCSFCRLLLTRRMLAATADRHFVSLPTTSVNTDSLLHRLQDVDKLRDNVDARQMNINVSDLCLRYTQLQLLDNQKTELVTLKKQNAQAMKQLMLAKPKNFESEKNKLIEKGKQLRSRTKQLLADAEYQSLCVEMLTSLLQLPNDIHPVTPRQGDVVIEEFGPRNDDIKPSLSHLELAGNSNCLFFRPKVSFGGYYLANDLAEAEHQLVAYSGQYLRRANIEQIMCPDLVKGFIADSCNITSEQGCTVEGCVAADVEPDVDNSCGHQHSLLLTGVSAATFSAFFSSAVVKSSALPLQLFSVGRSYSQHSVQQYGLYCVPQATTVNIYGVGRNLAETETLLDRFHHLTRQLYVDLQLRAKLVQVSASCLKPMEAARVDIYVWSIAFKQYFKCGELSLCSNYISERLAMKFADNVAGDLSLAKSLYSVHGVVLCVPSILASLAEAKQTVHDLLPKSQDIN